MSVLLQDLGRVLKKARTELGWSLDKLAAKTEISRGYLWKLEQGQSNPSIEVLHKIAGALSLPVAHLVALADPQRPPCEHPEFLLRAQWYCSDKTLLLITCHRCGEEMIFEKWEEKKKED